MDPQPKGALAMMQERAGAPAGPDALTMLTQMFGQLADPEKREKDEWLAFGAGLSSPASNGNLATAYGSGLAAQSAKRSKTDELQAQYLPLVMQALGANRQTQFGAAKAEQDYIKDMMPKLESHIGSMLADGGSPSHGEVVTKIVDVADQYRIPHSYIGPIIRSLPREPEKLRQHLNQMVAGAAGADKQMPSIGTNAAGQATVQRPAQGTVAPVGQAPGPAGGPAAVGPAGPMDANPTSGFVDWQKTVRGDVKGYEEGLRTRMDAYMQMLARMNEQAQYVKEFTPGRYAKMAGGIGSAVKDLGARLPGVDPAVVTDLANRIMGAQEGSKEALAAQQMFEQLAQQETIAQLKTALGEGQRMNMAEYVNFAKNNLGQVMDPETFKRMRQFYFNQAAETANHYSDWGDYVKDTGERASVTGFDSKYGKKRMDYLLAGGREQTPNVGPKDTPAAPKYPGAQPSPIVQDAPKAPPGPAAAGAPPPPPQATAVGPMGAKVDLAAFEEGAKVGPTGKVYVLTPQGPRPAKPRAMQAPGGGMQLPMTATPSIGANLNPMADAPVPPGRPALAPLVPPPPGAPPPEPFFDMRMMRPG